MEYEKILNDFYEQIEPISAVKPYMVAVGKSTSTVMGKNPTNCVSQVITKLIGKQFDEKRILLKLSGVFKVLKLADLS